jgi:hypothetical protein
MPAETGSIHCRSPECFFFFDLSKVSVENGVVEIALLALELSTL